MRHALTRPATAPLPMHGAAYAIAVALACAATAFVVAYATLAHFNRPLPPSANVVRYKPHPASTKPVRIIPLHTDASVKN